jgi:hypothetical protein
MHSIINTLTTSIKTRVTRGFAKKILSRGHGLSKISARFRSPRFSGRLKNSLTFNFLFRFHMYMILGLPDGSHFNPWSSIITNNRERLQCCFSGLTCVLSAYVSCILARAFCKLVDTFTIQRECWSFVGNVLSSSFRNIISKKLTDNILRTQISVDLLNS